MSTNMFDKVFVLLAVAGAALANVALVINPLITSPNATSVWTIGSVQTVTWNTAIIPAQFTTHNGSVVLGFLEKDSENLDLAHPLATGFQLGAGQVQVTVPNVTRRTNYVVDLFGDSGNISPAFTITA